jgi:ATP-dependent DNA ligase
VLAAGVRSAAFTNGRSERAAAELGVEGIVAKRADAPYPRGRTTVWIKIKTPAGKAIEAERAKWNER